jgi:predicted metal-binding membrane protein
MPFAFFLAEWRDGKVGALALGLKYGSYCVGCCWALMAVMLVVGSMNLLWLGALTLFVLGEKLVPARWRFGHLAGCALVLWGLVVAASLVR